MSEKNRGFFMGFEDLAAELHKQAEAEGRKAIHSAEKSARETEEEAKEKADALLRAAKREASEYARQESAERMTSAKLSAKKIIDEARDEAVEACLRQVWQQFRSDSLRKGSYPQIFARLLSEAAKELGSGDAAAYVRDEDRGLVPGMRAEKLPAGYSGGVLLESADGKVRVNKTLEEAFAQGKTALRKQIYDKLF